MNGHLVLLEHTAKTAHIRHALRTEELSADDPVLDRAEIFQAVLSFVTRRRPDNILIDLTQAGGDGCEFRYPRLAGDLILDADEFFADLLPGPVDVSLIPEYNGDDRQAETGNGTDLGDARYAGGCLFERKGDQSLYFRRRKRRRNGDDLYLIAGDVRKRVDRKSAQFQDAPEDPSQGEQTDDQLIPDGKADNGG